MLRARRYRVVFVFTAIFVLVIFHFSRSRNWEIREKIPVKAPEPHRPPVADSKAAPPSHHAPPPPQQLGKPAIPQAKPDPQERPPEGAKASDEKPSAGGAGEKTYPIEPAQEALPPQKKPGNQGLEAGTGGEGRVEAGRPDPSKPAVHWKKLPEHFPLDPEEIIKLPSGKSRPLPKLQARFKDESVSDKMTRLQRLATVKETFEHAWTGYKTWAMGHDELEPLFGGNRNPFNGWGATLVDTLDTLWIMDLKREFSAAVDEVKKIDFTTSGREDIPIFETAIRYLGGLLGAYDISDHKHTVLLDKARELADILIGAFDTPNRMPMLFYKWAPKSVAQPHLADAKATLAEIGSLSLEFTRLAQLSRDDKYYDAIARITNELEKLQGSTKLPGLWPHVLDASGCRKSLESKQNISPSAREGSPGNPSPPQKLEIPNRTDVESYKDFIGRRDSSGLGQDAQPADYGQMLGDDAESDDDRMDPSDVNCKEGLISAGSGSHTFGLGARADSTYEYMPKEYMLLGGLNEQYRSMYEKAMDTAREYLLFQPMVKDDRDLRFVSTVTLPESLAEQGPETWSYSYEGAHLTCFAGGMFGVGAKLFEIDGDLDIAAKLTDGCIWAYESTATGIMPEHFELLPCEKGKPCTWNETRYAEALDPHEGQRIHAAQKIYEQRVKFAKEAERKAADGNQADPISPPGAAALSEQHGMEQDEARPLGGLGPATNSGLAERDLSMPEAPTVLSHEDFVQARIQEERIPPGFVNIGARKYILRPEAIESVFLMYRLTGENYWREKGWKMFEAISKNTRTELANSGIHDVTAQIPRYRGEMESFWLAETLKYFYLLFSDPSVVSLDEYVLNTEAHPLKRPQY